MTHRLSSLCLCILGDRQNHENSAKMTINYGQKLVANLKRVTMRYVIQEWVYARVGMRACGCACACVRVGVRAWVCTCVGVRTLPCVHVGVRKCLRASGRARACLHALGCARVPACVCGRSVSQLNVLGIFALLKSVCPLANL